MAQRNVSQGTSTITETTMKQKLKALVLKLQPFSNQSPNTATRSNDELDGYIDQMIEDIHSMLVNKTLDLQKRIKQARPSVDDPQYEAKMKAYLNLLQIVQPLFTGMQDSFGEILDYFHRFINTLWDDITTNGGRNTDALLDNYSQQINNCMNGKWSRYFKAIEEKIAEIKRIQAY